MKKKPAFSKKSIIIFIIAFSVSVLLSGCYDARDIDDLAFVSGIALDKGDTNFLRMTLEIVVPKNIGAGEEGGGGGEEAVTYTTIEAPTMYSGMNMINNTISKQVDFSHAKILIFSEELAREGIHKYIHAVTRGRQFRGNMQLVVSKGPASEFLEEDKVILEANPSKHYELKYKSHGYTAFSVDSTLINFYLQEECTCSQAVATLGAVTRYKDPEDFRLEDSTFREKEREYPLEGDYIAGKLPNISESKSQIMGMAVFDGDKMVGETDGEETTYYLMLTGDYKYSYITIPDPLDEKKFIVLNISQKRNPKQKVKLMDGKPEIDIKISLEADILSVQSGRNYESVENIEILEKGTEEFFKKEMARFLEKTAKVFKSDICAFGRDLKSQYLLWEQWERVNWLQKYQYSTFNLEVDLNIRRPGLMIRSHPAYSKEGEEF